jgi:golgi-specific brefeldin A-resistance guanine nucleotide exchange factor 1
VLLFMASSGYLVPPSEDRTEAQEKLWTGTWKRIDRFLPELRRELAFDEEPEKAATPRKSLAKESENKNSMEQPAKPTAAAKVEEKQGEDDDDDDNDDNEEDEEEDEEPDEAIGQGADLDGVD